MVSRPTRCDRSRLKRLLEECLSVDDEAELSGHLERCPACRRGLEELAAESHWWGDVRLIRPDRATFEPTVVTPSGGTAPRAREDATPEGPPLDFLEPSPDLGCLGRLGPYRVVEVIGRGGMGIVLRAFDPALHRFVAIKVLAPELATSPLARRRFAREAKAAAAIVHDHVVAIYSVDETPGGLPYLVMQYVPGKSLEEKIHHSGPLAPVEILRIGTQVASGLAAAHAQGLIHRDIKPGNILLENGVERVKITDFGLARAVDDASLSQSGVVAGTPQYMAPEQARGDAIDHRADLFSLGSVLYALATGRPPFRADAAVAVLKRVCDEEPRPIRQINPAIPDWLEAIIARLQAKDPAARFPTAGAVADLLGGCLAHLQQPAQVPLPSEAAALAASRGAGSRGGRRRGVTMAAAVLVGLVGLGAGTDGFSRVAHFLATVLRIRTPQGTLVIETDDPSIKVQVDGQDVVITGAGPQEVRLSPGAHAVRMTRPGGPEKVQLVSIVQGGKETVKVSLEPETTPAAIGPDVASARLQDEKKLAELQLDRARQAADRGNQVARLEARVRELVESELARRARQAPAGGAVSFGIVPPTPHAPMLPPSPAGTPSVPMGLPPAAPGTVSVSGAADVQLAPATTPAPMLPPSPTGSPSASVSLPPPAPGRVSLPGGGDVVRLMPAPGAPRAPIALEPMPQPNPGVVIANRPAAPGRVGISFAHRVLPVTIPAFDVAVTPDGKAMALALMDGSIQLWSLPEGRLLFTLKGHSMRVWSVAFSPDGKTLASCGGEFDPHDRGELKLWDMASGREKSSLGGHEATVFCVAFSPDGKVLASGAWDNTARLWDVATGKIRAVLNGHTNAVRSVAFSPDGDTLATGSFDGSVKLWDAATGKERASLDVEPEGMVPGVNSVAFSPDGKTLAANMPVSEGDETRRDVVVLWDVSSRRVKARLRGFPDIMLTVAFSPDGKLLVAGGGSWGQSGTIRAWDVATGRQRGHFADLRVMVESLAFTPDGRVLISAGGYPATESEVILWDLHSRAPEPARPLYSGFPNPAATTPAPEAAPSATPSSSLPAPQPTPAPAPEAVPATTSAAPAPQPMPGPSVSPPLEVAPAAATPAGRTEAPRR